MRFFKVVVEVQEGCGSPGGLALPGGSLGERTLPCGGSPCRCQDGGVPSGVGYPFKRFRENPIALKI